MAWSKDGPFGSLSKVGTLTQMWGNPSGSCGEVQRQTPQLTDSLGLPISHTAFACSGSALW